MSPRYTAEFKEEAARQVLDNGYGIKETAERLGVHPHSLGKWVKQYRDPIIHAKEDSKQQERGGSSRTKEKEKNPYKEAYIRFS